MRHDIYRLQRKLSLERISGVSRPGPVREEEAGIADVGLVFGAESGDDCPLEGEFVGLAVFLELLVDDELEGCSERDNLVFGS
jgi:hypothetical protein